MRHYRKVIRIAAECSPNVKLGMMQRAAGQEPTDEELVPGVLKYSEYVKRRALWDEVRQCVGLDARFYEGSEQLLYPPEWLNRAEQLARTLKGAPRRAKSIGIDTGEGVADTAMTAVDELGIVEQQAQKTFDTSRIDGMVAAFGRKHGVPPERWLFDRGGGGLQVADRLRAQGMRARTVAFGESLVSPPQYGMRTVEERVEQVEERYAYVNRRAQMFGVLSLLLDPDSVGAPEVFAMLRGVADAKWKSFGGFAVPAEYTLLREELAPVPRLYDAEGRLKLPPKNRRSPNSAEKSLVELIGRSPDRADSLVLAVFGMLDTTNVRVARVR